MMTFPATSCSVFSACTSVKLSLLIYLLSLHFSGGGAENAIPKLELIVIGEQWQNLTLPTTHSRIFSSEQGDDLTFGCEAKYPIQWNFTGFISPPEVVKIQPPKRNLIEKTYFIQVAIFFLEAEDFSGVGSSLRLACEKVGNFALREEVFIFVRGARNEPLVRPSRTTVMDSTLIPCPTKDPTLVPKLYIRTANGNEELVRSNDVRYHLTEGFRSSQVFNGVYVCRQGSSSVTITARVATTSSQFPNSDDYEFYPKSSTVRVFTEDTIQFECFSKSQRPVRLIVDKMTSNEPSDVIVSHMNINQRMITQVSSRTTDGTKGRIVCLADSNKFGNTGNLVKEWNFEFVPTPELFLDNFEREVYCLSDDTSKTVQTVRCKNTMDCNFMSHCLENVTNCNYKKQKQFFATKNTRCWIAKLDIGRECVSVPFSHLNGLAQCNVSGLVKKWEYFVSLDFLSYSDWKEAPERELLRMDEMPSILYTNQTTQFFCTAVAYLFTDSLTFEIEFKNGTRMLVPQNGRFGNVSNPGQESSRKIDEFNVLGVLDIKLPIDTVGIHCYAPWWNRVDGLKTSRVFETRHLLKPQLTDDVRDALKQETFYIGEKNRRLTCFAKGEPQPEYTWYFNKTKKVSEIFPDLKTSLGSSGEGYLEFPQIGEGDSGTGKKYSGQYHCMAMNMVGSVERRFQLDVIDEPISGKSVVYIVTVVVILLILAFVLAMLFIFMRRYNEARELVRSLTDIEIDEFFQGKPELLENANGNITVIDFLPYKNEYEIPLEDLEFDTSEKNLLGSGEFSYVVRGRIVSKSKPVAVKISKPSADVTLFKSLLSEVKIMIYIGEHDNVVALVGVCTQAIRNRSIHIATDICDLGSLDGFLRKARPSFINLMDGNQEINLSLLPESSSRQTNTLDLISFSGQIAKGMEYLASKSVIHADLAARNVLLTGSKVAKISDFGLSKKLYESNNYVKKSKSPLPWRWMAIESLTTLTFSTSSDIWAYGVTLFEIFTLGDIPFPNEEWNKEFLNRLASGMRMGRPKYSTQEIYSKTVACWESEPEIRPNFTTLRVFFEELLRKYSYNLTTTSGSNNDDGSGSTVIADPPLEHSEEPITTTGGPLYVNYDGDENINPSNDNGGVTHPLQSASTINYAELDHDHNPMKEQSQYVNTPNGESQHNELETSAQKMEPAPRLHAPQKPTYVNFE